MSAPTPSSHNNNDLGFLHQLLGILSLLVLALTFTLPLYIIISSYKKISFIVKAIMGTILSIIDPEHYNTGIIIEDHYNNNNNNEINNFKNNQDVREHNYILMKMLQHKRVNWYRVRRCLHRLRLRLEQQHHDHSQSVMIRRSCLTLLNATVQQQLLYKQPPKWFLDWIIRQRFASIRDICRLVARGSIRYNTILKPQKDGDDDDASQTGSISWTASRRRRGDPDWDMIWLWAMHAIIRCNFHGASINILDSPRPPPESVILALLRQQPHGSRHNCLYIKVPKEQVTTQGNNSNDNQHLDSPQPKQYLYPFIEGLASDHIDLETFRYYARRFPKYILKRIQDINSLSLAKFQILLENNAVIQHAIERSPSNHACSIVNYEGNILLPHATLYLFLSTLVQHSIHARNHRHAPKDCPRPDQWLKMIGRIKRDRPLEFRSFTDKGDSLLHVLARLMVHPPPSMQQLDNLDYYYFRGTQYDVINHNLNHYPFNWEQHIYNVPNGNDGEDIQRRASSSSSSLMTMESSSSSLPPKTVWDIQILHIVSLFHFVLESFPESTRIRNNEDKLALELLLAALLPPPLPRKLFTSRRQQGKLHCPSFHLSMDFVYTAKLVASADPDALLLPNTRQFQAPLQALLHQKNKKIVFPCAPWVELVVGMNPATLEQTCHQTGLYPFQYVAAACATTNPDNDGRKDQKDEISREQRRQHEQEQQLQEFRDARQVEAIYSILRLAPQVIRFS